jgi:hypothetical protein
MGGVIMAGKRRIGLSTPEQAIDDVWQRRATAAAIVAVREVINSGSIPPNTSILRLSDVEVGWLFAAALFAWIRTRAEQATAEGWDTELTLRLTSHSPPPWDAGAVASILPQLADLPGVDWNQPIGRWPKDAMVRFLLEALKLVDRAMIARDVGGTVATNRKSLEEMQREASAAAGGSLVAPNELDDPIGF